ncbi:MAG: FAD-binding protein, partial [Alphaproteobacteria bacterium]|nr:FAD-binding protein [Alphaproteobacteria bacterium]
QKDRRVVLDARRLADFATCFPTIHAFCAAAGVDPSTQPIPVRPAAHYHMGGVAVDENGAASVEGLWACGEVAATGLHGANRLASNSLLEAVVCGLRVAARWREAIQRAPRPRRESGNPVAAPAPAGREEEIRDIMSAYVGVLRDRAGLEKAIEELTPRAQFSDRALVGLMIARAALRREESRGAHYREDFPATKTALGRSNVSTLEGVLA